MWTKKAAGSVLVLIVGFFLISASLPGQHLQNRLANVVSALFTGLLLTVMVCTETATEDADLKPKCSCRKDSGLSRLVGSGAIVITPLRPVGKIEQNGKVYDAVAEGDFIDKGATVRIIGSSLHQLKVRLHEYTPSQSGEIQ